MNKSKISPLIVVDPIQPERNAAAALSKEKFDLFKSVAAKFLKNPSRKFFVFKEFDADYVMEKNQGHDVFVLDITAKSGKQDVVGSKLLKAFEYIGKKLKAEGFHLVEADWKWNKAKKAEFYYVVRKEELPETYEQEGPPIKVRDHARAFAEKHEETFIKKGRIYAIIKRKYIKAGDFLKELIRDIYVIERVTKARLK